MKFAVTNVVSLVFSVIVQVGAIPAEAHALPHPAKVEPPLGVSVSVTMDISE